jgi:prevent-host-death family protein
MPQIGIRQLKAEASEVIRAVREERAEYVVTHRGRAVAVILPVAESEAVAEAPSHELLAALDEHHARITADRRSGGDDDEQWAERSLRLAMSGMDEDEALTYSSADTRVPYR